MSNDSILGTGRVDRDLASLDLTEEGLDGTKALCEPHSSIVRRTPQMCFASMASPYKLAAF